MKKRLLMGNEAIALGALRAGVRVVTGYPGTPSSEVLETVAKHRHEMRGVSPGYENVYVEWSVNEKSAMEVAAGAAYAGARVMVTMKQVGLNVASDPFVNVNYIGVKGGMVVVVADDPGPISSQNEQDTRSFSKFAKVALFDPSTPEEAYTMIADAFECSEKYGKPVIFRPTTRVCHSCASVEILEDLPRKEPEGFVKDPKWVIFPRLAYANKFKIEENLISMRKEFSDYEKNKFLTEGTEITEKKKKGIATGGVSYAYTQEAISSLLTSHSSLPYSLLKISTYPFPDELAVKFLQGLDEVLVIEELDPVIENELIRVCGLYHLKVKILGKQTGHIQIAGENTVDSVAKAVFSFLEVPLPETANAAASSQGTAKTEPHEAAPPALPVRPPVLCAGCPHRASFFAVKEATKNISAVYTGDIGCYTLGNASPLNMVDTCLCMGAGITVAQGLKIVEDMAARMPPKANSGVHLKNELHVENRQGSRFSTHFAFIGDSTFFHTGIPGVINAVYNQTDIVVVVLDNSTTAMTGNQPHPGMGVTMMGGKPEKISIEKIVTASGVSAVVKANPFDLNAAKEAVASVIDKKGVRVLLFEAPCIAIAKDSSAKQAADSMASGRCPTAVDTAKCTGCKICITKFGCPAISLESGKAQINSALCTGCGVCASVCPLGAIK